MRFSAFSCAMIFAPCPAVARLPEEFRSVYQMHAIDGRSYSEIALKLALPKNTVGTRLIRARRKLRDLLLPHLRREEEGP